MRGSGTWLKCWSRSLCAIFRQQRGRPPLERAGGAATATAGMKEAAKGARWPAMASGTGTTQLRDLNFRHDLQLWRQTSRVEIFTAVRSGTSLLPRASREVYPASPRLLSLPRPRRLVLLRFFRSSNPRSPHLRHAAQLLTPARRHGSRS